MNARVTDIALVDATHDLLAAAENAERLSPLLNAAIADGWLVFPEALAPTLGSYERDRGPRLWGTIFFLTATPRTLIGWGGYVGEPDDDGIVEIGYSLAPGFRGRGFATAAARAMVARAFADPSVKAVAAHTLAEENASTSVLKKLGFAKTGEIDHPADGRIWAWRLTHPAAHPS